MYLTSISFLVVIYLTSVSATNNQTVKWTNLNSHDVLSALLETRGLHESIVCKTFVSNVLKKVGRSDIGSEHPKFNQLAIHLLQHLIIQENSANFGPEFQKILRTRVNTCLDEFIKKVLGDSNQIRQDQPEIISTYRSGGATTSTHSYGNQQLVLDGIDISQSNVEHPNLISAYESRISQLERENTLLKQTLNSASQLIDKISHHVDMTHVTYPEESLFSIELPGLATDRVLPITNGSEGETYHEQEANINAPDEPTVPEVVPNLRKKIPAQLYTGQYSTGILLEGKPDDTTKSRLDVTYFGPDKKRHSIVIRPPSSVLAYPKRFGFYKTQDQYVRTCIGDAIHRKRNKNIISGPTTN